MHRPLITLTILTVVIAAPALAQQAPPTRVGRVSFVSGNLAFPICGRLHKRKKNLRDCIARSEVALQPRRGHQAVG